MPHDHYATLFPRQDILDLGATAADDGAAAAEGARPHDGPELVESVQVHATSDVARDQGFTWSEQHRRECEARYVMRLPLDARRTHYQHVREKRGEPAMRDLVAEVNRQWKMVNEG